MPGKQGRGRACLRSITSFAPSIARMDISQHNAQCPTDNDDKSLLLLPLRPPAATLSPSFDSTVTEVEAASRQQALMRIQISYSAAALSIQQPVARGWPLLVGAISSNQFKRMSRHGWGTHDSDPLLAGPSTFSRRFTTMFCGRPYHDPPPSQDCSTSIAITVAMNCKLGPIRWYLHGSNGCR
ncbi:hypothetical protein Vretifemale_3747, partial [Volvox reticuliferus]